MNGCRITNDTNPQPATRVSASGPRVQYQHSQKLTVGVDIVERAFSFLYSLLVSLFFLRTLIKFCSRLLRRLGEDGAPVSFLGDPIIFMVVFGAAELECTPVKTSPCRSKRERRIGSPLVASVAGCCCCWRSVWRCRSFSSISRPMSSWCSSWRTDKARRTTSSMDACTSPEFFGLFIFFLVSLFRSRPVFEDLSQRSRKIPALEAELSLSSDRSKTIASTRAFPI